MPALYAVAATAASHGAGTPVPVYGMVADGVVTRALEVDVEHANALASHWPGRAAAVLGGLGGVVAAPGWRRSRAMRRHVAGGTSCT